MISEVFLDAGTISFERESVFYWHLLEALLGCDFSISSTGGGSKMPQKAWKDHARQCESDMDRKQFKKEFAEGSLPSWSCPHCKKGILLVLEDSLTFKANAKTKAEWNEDYWEPEWSEYVVTARLGCPACKEVVAMCGRGTVEEEYDENEDRIYQNYVAPTFFQPALEIIALPSATPKVVAELLQSSFKLFWCDSDACANRVRSGVEALLDEMGIPRKKNKADTRLLTLHARILLIDDPLFLDVRRAMEAVKWLGNTGSHEAGGLTRNDVLDAYELLEFCLERIYPIVRDYSILLAKADAINLIKGPVRD